MLDSGELARYDKLSSAIATRFAPAPITRIATKNQLVYAACGAAICVFKRQLLVAELGTHDEPIVDMILLGDVLLTVCAGNVLKVRKIPQACCRDYWKTPFSSPWLFLSRHQHDRSGTPRRGSWCTTSRCCARQGRLCSAIRRRTSTKS